MNKKIIHITITILTLILCLSNVCAYNSPEIKRVGIVYDEVVATTPYHKNGSIPVLGDKFIVKLYFKIAIDDISGELLSSQHTKMTHNIPTSRDSYAMELFQRRTNRYTFEHDMYIGTNRPAERERIVVTVESTGPLHKRARNEVKVTKIRYVDLNNPHITKHIIYFD